MALDADEGLGEEVEAWGEVGVGAGEEVVLVAVPLVAGEEDIVLGVAVVFEAVPFVDAGIEAEGVDVRVGVDVAVVLAVVPFEAETVGGGVEDGVRVDVE